MNAAIHPLERLGVDDYLQAEQRAEVKHEYLDGQIFAVGGASRAHGLLTLSLSALLLPHARRKGCQLERRVTSGGRTKNRDLTPFLPRQQQPSRHRHARQIRQRGRHGAGGERPEPGQRHQCGAEKIQRHGIDCAHALCWPRLGQTPAGA